MSIPKLLPVALFLAMSGVGDSQPAKPENQLPRKELLVDRYGDPLPEGAIARLGTVRFRHGYFANAIAFSPNGKVLASGGRYPGLRLWDATSGKLLSRPSIHGVTSLAFSPDSKTILVSSGTPTLIDVASGKELARFPSTSDFVALSPDGETVAAEQRDTVVLLKVSTHKQIRQLQGHAGQVHCLAFSPNGKALATGSQDNTIRLWDVTSGRETRRFEAKDVVTAVAFSPNGKLLAWIDEKDPTIRLVDLVAGQPDKLLKGLDGPVYSIAFSRDGKLVASGGHGGKIHLWDANTGKELRHLQAFGFRVGHLAFSPDSRTLASTGHFASSAIRLWDTASGKEIRPVAGHTGVVQSLKFSANGKKLFSLGRDQRGITWNVVGGAEEGSAAQVGPFGKRPAALSPDGKVLATAKWFQPTEKSDGVIWLWDTRTGKRLRALDRHKQPVGALAYSEDGKILASGSNDGIFLWDPTTGKVVRHIKGHQARVWTLAFSPNGKLLASEGEDKKVRLWNVETGKELREWDSNQQFGPALTFSPDSKLLASTDHLMSVWEVGTGREVMHVPTEYGHVNAMAFSPSGRFVAGNLVQYRALPTGEDHFSIVLWELVSGQVARRIDRREETAWSLAFHPNGRILASGGGDSTILLWDMTGRLKNGLLQPARLTDKDLDKLWKDLGGEAPIGYRAIWTFAAARSQTIPFLAKQLQPVAAADPKRILPLIADLESNKFAVRAKAFKELAQLGELAEPALREAKPSQPTIDFRQRVDLLLAKLKGPETDPERLRKLRAIEVLENIGSTQARKILERLATGTTAARLTREARESLQRLNERQE